jgi:hypothetical protein
LLLYDCHTTAPLLHAEINLAPKHLEIMHGGSYGAYHHEPQQRYTERLQRGMLRG